MRDRLDTTAAARGRRAGITLAVAAAVTVLGLAAAPAASAHDSSIRWIPLNAGSSSSAYSLEYKHTSHKLTMIAYFGQVTRSSVYFDKITFKYSNVDARCIFGGKAYIWNGSLELVKQADAGRMYCSSASFTMQVDRTFRATNGNMSVAVQKDSVDSFWGGVWHRSNAVFYVP